jgi:hypothetical protein
MVGDGGRQEVYVNDHGDGELTVTFVTWAD